MTGGSVSGVGNVTAAAEFNMHYDPLSARAVFRSPTTKLLLPLEITQRLSFGWELVDSLPSRSCRLGAVLHDIIPHLFRSTRQLLGRETVSFQALAAIMWMLEPSLIQFAEMAGDVEIAGELTRGATVFDQREPRGWRNNLEVARELDVELATEAFFNALKYASQTT